MKLSSRCPSGLTNKTIQLIFLLCIEKPWLLRRCYVYILFSAHGLVNDELGGGGGERQFYVY